MPLSALNLMLHSRVFGHHQTHPPLIILHGLFGSSRNWLTLAKAWAQLTVVHVLDLPNHGLSSHHNSPFTYAMMADAVDKYLTSQSIENYDLLGHSMGGKVVFECMANRRPPQHAIVLDIAPKSYPRHHDDVLAAIRNCPLNQIHDRKAAYTHLHSTLHDDALCQFLLQSFIPGQPSHWQFNAPVIDRDYTSISTAPTLPDTPCSIPLLLLCGGQSPYVNEADKVALSRLFSDVNIQTIPDASHWLHASHSAKIRDSVAHYLKFRYN